MGLRISLTEEEPGAISFGNPRLYSLSSRTKINLSAIIASSFPCALMLCNPCLTGEALCLGHTYQIDYLRTYAGDHPEYGAATTSLPLNVPGIGDRCRHSDFALAKP